jgi:hypothetical protein
LTHEQWYTLPKWERDTWLAREMYKEDYYRKLKSALIDKTSQKLSSPHALAPAYYLQSLLV